MRKPHRDIRRPFSLRGAKPRSISGMLAGAVVSRRNKISDLRFILLCIPGCASGAAELPTAPLDRQEVILVANDGGRDRDRGRGIQHGRNHVHVALHVPEE